MSDTATMSWPSCSGSVTALNHKVPGPAFPRRLSSLSRPKFIVPELPASSSNRSSSNEGACYSHTGDQTRRSMSSVAESMTVNKPSVPPRVSSLSSKRRSRLHNQYSSEANALNTSSHGDDSVPAPHNNTLPASCDQKWGSPKSCPSRRDSTGLVHHCPLCPAIETPRSSSLSPEPSSSRSASSVYHDVPSANVPSDRTRDAVGSAVDVASGLTILATVPRQRGDSEADAKHINKPLGSVNPRHSSAPRAADSVYRRTNEMGVMSAKSSRRIESKPAAMESRHKRFSRQSCRSLPPPSTSQAALDDDTSQQTSSFCRISRQKVLALGPRTTIDSDTFWESQSSMKLLNTVKSVIRRSWVSNSDVAYIAEPLKLD